MEAKDPELHPYQSIITEEITMAYWTYLVDGEIVDRPVLRAEDGRWLDAGTWARMEDSSRVGK